MRFRQAHDTIRSFEGQYSPLATVLPCASKPRGIDEIGSFLMGKVMRMLDRAGATMASAGIALEIEGRRSVRAVPVASPAELVRQHFAMRSDLSVSHPNFESIQEAISNRFIRLGNGQFAALRFLCRNIWRAILVSGCTAGTDAETQETHVEVIVDVMRR
jgi:hypothetical protein